MKRKYFLSILIVLLIIILADLYLIKNNKASKMDENLLHKMKTISNVNIFFGHRSVGDNIIQGINELYSQNGINKLTIYRLENFNRSSDKYFVHSYIGSNGDPKSKIDDFSKYINQLASQNLDIAFMKLCFADIKSNTDVNDIFKYYVSTIDTLKSKYPNLIILHFTVPLTSKRTFLMSIKDLIKGRSDNSLLDNVMRNKYNQLILSKYSSDKIFDIAKIESTYETGEREKEIYNGDPIYFLINDYSIDGGHLNEKGQSLIASKLISFISNQENYKRYSSYYR